MAAVVDASKGPRSGVVSVHVFLRQVDVTAVFRVNMDGRIKGGGSAASADGLSLYLVHGLGHGFSIFGGCVVVADGHIVVWFVFL